LQPTQKAARLINAVTNICYLAKVFAPLKIL
jgi:hypothetical protein